MDYIALLGIAVGLSMDAFAVSITNGASNKKAGPLFALKLGVAFGIFQAVMPTLGWLIGKAGESFISSVDHWIALVLLGIIGVQMIVESTKKKKENTTEETSSLSFKTLMALAVATSIDALATGVLLPTAVQATTPLLMLLAVGIIGIVAFTFSFVGVFAGKKFGTLLSGKAEIVGGIVLIAIGIKIFVEHMFF